jgi:hypothetical protein
MKTLADDRRTTRSSDLSTALQHLLDAHRTKGALDAVALSTDEGLLLASSGDDAELLGAIAPILARGRDVPVLAPEQTTGVSVHAFLVAGREFYLAMRGANHDPSHAPVASRPQLALSGMQAATRILRSS